MSYQEISRARGRASIRVDIRLRNNLILLGKDEDIELEVKMTSASNLLELQRLEVWAQRTQVSNTLMSLSSVFGLDQVKWGDRILHRAMGLSKSEIKQLRTMTPQPVDPPQAGTNEPIGPDSDGAPQKQKKAAIGKAEARVILESALAARTKAKGMGLSRDIAEARERLKGLLGEDTEGLDNQTDLDYDPDS